MRVSPNSSAGIRAAELLIRPLAAALRQIISLYAAAQGATGSVLSSLPLKPLFGLAR